MKVSEEQGWPSIKGIYLCNWEWKNFFYFLFYYMPVGNGGKYCKLFKLCSWSRESIQMFLFIYS
jgi:hypothetical protein